MILTPDLVYIHVPRTGGSFVRHCLEAAYGDEAINYLPAEHRGVKFIPKSHKGLPIYASWRIPTHWYVSHWAYRNRHNQSMITTRMAEDVSFADWYEALHNRPGNLWNDQHGEALQYLVSKGWGYMTAYYAVSFLSDPYDLTGHWSELQAIQWLTPNRMKGQLARLLPHANDYIRALGIVNPSKHKDPIEYFTGGLAADVLKRDKLMYSDFFVET